MGEEDIADIETKLLHNMESVEYIILDRFNKILSNEGCINYSQINTESRNIENGLVKNKLILLLFSIDYNWNLTSYGYFFKNCQEKIE